MAVKPNTITISSIPITIANSEVEVEDVFIDGQSLQLALKSKYVDAFSKGRYREPFLTYLGREFNDKNRSDDSLLRSPIPNENETSTAALYGCTDGCCVYLYVSLVSRICGFELAQEAFLAGDKGRLRSFHRI